MKKVLSKEYLITELKEAIVAEQTAGDFYRYLSKYILNSNMRNEFKKMADEEAVWHKNLLNGRLVEMLGQAYEPDLSKLDVNIEASKFSLIGAFKMAKDSEARAVEFYNKAKKRDKIKHRKMYDNIIKEEKRHWRYLDKERRFIEKRIQYSDIDGLRLYSFLRDAFK